MLSPTELYAVAQRYALEEQCLRIMSITGYADAAAIQRHWTRLTEEVLRGAGSNKLEVLKARVVSLAREFNTPGRRAYFPVSYVLEVLLRSALKCPGMTLAALQEWMAGCGRDCGLRFEEAAGELRLLVDAGSEPRWLVSVCGVYVRWACEGGVMGRVVEDWLQFIVVKNIDPREKGVFVQSSDGLKKDLQRMKTEVEACKDGRVKTDRDVCVAQIDTVLKKLKEQEKREKSVLYGKMML